MIKPFVTPEDVASLLNDAWNIDPRAIEALVKARVVCNLTLANHPTIQVLGHRRDGTLNPEIPQGADFAVGMLGLFNGLFGTNEEGKGPIEIVYDPQNPTKVKGFRVVQ